MDRLSLSLFLHLDCAATAGSEQRVWYLRQRALAREVLGYDPRLEADGVPAVAFVVEEDVPVTWASPPLMRRVNKQRKDTDV